MRHRPEAQGSSLYPNEVASDFAFIPFGGGMRKCVGDQFALMEATVVLAMLLKYVCNEILLVFSHMKSHVRCAWCTIMRIHELPSASCAPLCADLWCRRFSFSFEMGPEAVGMASGATIHTANGLATRITQRTAAPPAKEPTQQSEEAAATVAA